MNRLYKHLKFAAIPRGPILDIGSGSNPFWRANVLMERFLEDDSQRPGKLIVDRPMVCGDIQNIPFVDNAFVFVHCSHLLEHIADPQRAIAEMVRVSSAGYIETPSELHEFIDLNFPFHRWAVSEEDRTLVFREKPREVSRHPLIEALQQNNNRTIKLIRRNHGSLNVISLFWQNEVKCRIVRCDNPMESYSKNDDVSKANNYAVGLYKSKLKRVAGRILSPRIDILKIIACPICTNKTIANDDNVECTKCHKSFPIINETPMMLKEYSS